MDGLLFWVRGWRLLWNDGRLLTVALLPLVIAFTSTASLLWLLWSYLPLWSHQLVDGWMGLAPGVWHDVLYYPIVISAGILAFMSSVYVIYVLQALIAMPFYSLLADRALWMLGKKPEESLVWQKWVRKTLRMMRVSLLKAFLLLTLGLVLFLFSFLPMLNFVALAGAMMILAWDCMDYSFEALDFGFRQRVRYLTGEMPQWMGMAAGLGLTLFIPGLTLLVIPGAVVGAAIILKNAERPKDESRAPAP